MSLVQRVAELAARIGDVVAIKIDASHPGVARAWVCFGYISNQVVIRAAFNVQSVTRVANGKYRVTFAAPMPDENYCWTAFARNAGSQLAMKFASVRVDDEAKTADFVEVICTTQAGLLSDTTELNLMVFR